MFPGSQNKLSTIYTLENINNQFNDDMTDCSSICSKTTNNSVYNELTDEDENLVDNTDTDINLVNINTWTYNALCKLDYNVDKLNIYPNYNVFICIFNVNNDYLFPFLQYLLVNGDMINGYSFPYFYLNDIQLLYPLCDTYIESLQISGDNQSLELKGCKEVNNNIYVFYELIGINISQQTPLYTWVLIDELVNSKKVLRNPVCSNVHEFFNYNSEFAIIYNSKNIPYEIPTVVYNLIEDKKIDFNLMFGVTKSEYNAILGPYYYFSDYNNSIKCINNNKKYSLLRSALFLGNMKVILNNIEDEVDSSDIKKNLLCEEELRHYEKQTMRISDYDGKWVDSYDSVYLGKLELDDGYFLTNTPLWVVKEYSQQVTLSKHFISTSVL
jgi:hypothetical protein